MWCMAQLLCMIPWQESRMNVRARDKEGGREGGGEVYSSLKDKGALALYALKRAGQMLKPRSRKESGDRAGGRGEGQEGLRLES